MWSILRTGAMTLALAVIVVVGLVAIPGYTGTEALESMGWLARALRVLSHVASGVLPEASPLTRTTSLYADLPRLLFESTKLVVGAMCCALLMALPTGIGAAIAPFDAKHRAVSRVLMTVSSMPAIVWATVLLLLSLKLEISITTNARLAFLSALATLVLGDRLVGDLITRIESATKEVLDEPYMRTVRASGFHVLRHVAQGLVPPVSDAVASRTLFLIGGAIVVERLFDIRGLGFRVFESLQANPLERELIVVCTIGLVVLGLIVRSAASGAAMLADGRRRS
jgi:ABC-type dipeptide/oligopeptide/nickel transport system permease component